MELARLAELHLDPWEEFTLRHSLNEREDGKWAAFEVGLCAPRQNGKGSILEARQLAGLFLLGERLLIHSAHEQNTASEHFLRLLALIEGVPELSKRMLKPSRGKGAEAIKLKSGQRIFFKTRTGGGGRGLSGDFVGLDEAMILPGATVGALMPTLSARSVHGNPQLWYSGSAVDKALHDHGLVFARVRERGISGTDPSLMYVEWSADAETPDDVSPQMALDPEVWAQANPGLGIRIDVEHVAKEQRSMDHRTFCVERLGVGDWPATDGNQHDGIDLQTWLGLTDEESTVEDPIVVAFDVKPDRSASSICMAGMREDGRLHVESIDNKQGTGWVVDRLVQIAGTHDVAYIVCDSKSPAASLLPQLEAAGVDVETVDGHEYAQACGRFFDAVEQGTVHHLGQQELATAIKGARKRPLGDAWAWSRKSSAVDISPLVACTLALWKYEESEIGEPFVLEVFG